MVLIFIEAREMLNNLVCHTDRKQEVFLQNNRIVNVAGSGVQNSENRERDLLSELHWPKMIHCRILALPLDKSTSTDQILRNESH
jgi:hypothetical protein